MKQLLLTLVALTLSACVSDERSQAQRAEPVAPEAFVIVAEGTDWGMSVAAYRHTKTGRCFVIAARTTGIAMVETDKAVCE